MDRQMFFKFNFECIVTLTVLVVTNISFGVVLLCDTLYASDGF